MKFPEHYRLRGAQYGPHDSTTGDDFGAFVMKRHGEAIRMIATAASEAYDEPGMEHVSDWEHVSVSLERRCPTWEEMCIVKALFWDAEETVVQFHPPESDYVNAHRFCLHLWRYKGEMPRPPSITVGPQASQR